MQIHKHDKMRTLSFEPFLTLNPVDVHALSPAGAGLGVHADFVERPHQPVSGREGMLHIPSQFFMNVPTYDGHRL